jgi:hypothetical protein
MPEIDHYEWWKNALKGEFGPIHDGHPQLGFYRAQTKKGGVRPVAVWLDEETQKPVAKFGETMVDADKVWIWCCMNPIDWRLYQDVMQGGAWPADLPPPKKFERNPMEASLDDVTAGVGHNKPPTDEPHSAEEFHEAIKAAVDGARDDYKKGISDKVAADRVTNWRERLNALSKAADKRRREEKAPHEEAADKLQKVWQPLVDDAKTAANQLRDALTKWLQEETKRQVAEQARMAEQGQIKKTEPVRSGTGSRRTGLRTVKTAKITDFKVLLNHLADNDKVVEVVTKIANHSTRS